MSDHETTATLPRLQLGPDRGKAERLPPACAERLVSVQALLADAGIASRYIGRSRKLLFTATGHHRFGRCGGQRVYMVATNKLPRDLPVARAAVELLAYEYHDIEAKASLQSFDLNGS